MRRILPARSTAFWRACAAGGLLLTAACGPVPHPFQHEETSPLLEDRWALLPVTVRAPTQPLLVDSMIKALEDQDIAAGTEAGPQALSLEAQQEGSQLVWRLYAPNGKGLGETRQPAPARWTPLTVGELTATMAPIIARALRGSDGGQIDLESRPRIALAPIQAPPGMDPRQLALMMRRALAGLGIALAEDVPSPAASPPAAVVEGRLTLLKGAGKENILQVDWTARDAAGQELGTVSQGGPVDRGLVLGDLGPMARDIAAAGAPGVAQVIEKGLHLRE